MRARRISSLTDLVSKSSTAAAASQAGPLRCRICLPLDCHRISQQAKRRFTDREERFSTHETMYAVREKASRSQDSQGGSINVSQLITSIPDFAGRGGRRLYLHLTSSTRKTRFIPPG